MNQLKLKDNAQISKSCFAQVPNLTARIADKTLEQLEQDGIFVFPASLKEADDITKDQMILQSVNDRYRTGNVMGFLGYGDERLLIESRFCGSNEDFFFQYLLNKVLDFPNLINMETAANTDHQLFYFLLFLFPQYLKQAMRKGLYKSYIHSQYNNSHVSGTIDVARHIAVNTPFVGKIAYSKREFSYDNQLTELIRHTIEFIKKKPYGNKLLLKVKDEVKLIVNATPQYRQCDKQSIVTANKKNTVHHAYYHEYQMLQRLCLLILQYQKHQIGSGSRQVYGILFDGAWLWEEYVHLLIGDLFYHPKNKHKDGTQHLFSHNIGAVYPDFIGNDPKNRIIADAKYKPVENIANKDYLQVLAYMFRFDAKTGLYFYPEAKGGDSVIHALNSGTTFEKNITAREDIRVIKHGLHIPMDASNYQAFSEMMQENETAFRKESIEYLGKPI